MESLRKQFQRTARMRGVDAAWADIDAQVKELQEQNDCLCRKTFCAYCGEEFPLDTVTAEQVGEHIRICEKHPMRIVERERDEAVKAVAESKTTIAALEQSVDDLIATRNRLEAEVERLKKGE